LEDLEPYTPPAFAQHFDAAMQAPWTRQDYPLIADWLDANAETLTRLETASHRRGYFAPYIGDESLFEGKLPGLHFARDLARMLTARAQLHIGQGDLDGAWRDLLTLKRFGRLMQQSGPIIPRLVGMSLQHLAYGVIDDLLSADDLKHEQAVRIISDMAALAPENWLIDAIDRDERWMALDALMRFVMQPQRAEASPFAPDDTNRIGALIAASRGFDMNPLLRGVNGHFDQVVQMLRSDASPEQKMQQRKEQFVGLAMDSATLQFVLEARLQAKGQPMPREMYNEQLQRLLSMLVRKDWLPACIGAYRSQLAQQLKHQVEVAAVAIAAYGVQRGHYPDTLDDLVRQYLPSVPRDADGRPLRYRREGHDASVYSIGPDLADNGGLADSDDDIVMYLRGHSANDGGDEH
jgi:hypothetical protein